MTKPDKLYEQLLASTGDAISGWLAVAQERGFPIPEPR